MTLDTSHAQDAGLSPERATRLVAVLQSEIDRHRLPGTVVVVARHGHIAIQQALGLQDPATAQPMAVDSIFRLYSMTKPIVSVAMLMLMEQGKFLLADPVSKYLPEFANQQVAVERNGLVTLEPVLLPATIQDLMRHTAGLTYEFAGTSAVQRMYVERQLNRRVPGRNNEAYCKVLAQVPLMFQPGTLGEYSRATDVLGRLVEVFSGQSLGAYLHEHILAPLGMADTAFWVPTEKQGRIAEPFAKDPDGAPLMVMGNVREQPDMESGGGGMVGTARDYMRFAQMLLNKGQLDEVRLLGSRTVKFMTSDHMGNIPSRDTLLEPGEGFGLGFAVRTATGLTPVPGSIGTFYWSGMAGTSFFVDPAQELVAVMMIQAPNQRAWYRQLFRNLVYACLVD